MPDYREHPSKPVRLEPGGMVLLDAGDCTVWFYLDDGSWEGLAGLSVAEDVARVMAVPVFAYGIGLGDEVRVRAGDNAATGLVRSAGNRTFRVVFPRTGAPFPRSGPPEPDERWRTLLADLEPHGCWLDVYSPRLVAVSAEADRAEDVMRYLTEREERGELAFEAGR